MRLKENLDNAALDLFTSGRPLLTHLNADTSWLLTLSHPHHVNPQSGRFLFNILIDPWFRDAQTDYFSWFSKQWHVVPSSVQTIAELNECLGTMETTIRNQQHNTNGSIGASTSSLGDLKANYIDMVIISHEFTDHCNRETLREIASSTLVLAPKPAARLISSWRHFQRVHSIAAFSNEKHEWKSASTSDIPPSLRIARIISNRDAMSFHSAILITFDNTSSTEGASVEGIVYTPHGINADDLEQLSVAAPRINVLALLHGLHDIKISRRQLNLGAHNALRAQRVSGSRYWLSTHDEVKKAGGLVNHFLRRKIWTIEDVLEEEKRQNETLDIGSPLAEIRDIHFANLESGESLLLR
ncbi:MAG: hypothetical protein Q9168_004309 [Polycauliona sp. 1 TL-2023]